MDIGRLPGAGYAAEAAPIASAAAVLSPHDIAQQREVIKAVRALEGSDLLGKNSELTFVFDRHTQRALVRVIDKKTKQVVMQIPPEYLIKMAEAS